MIDYIKLLYYLLRPNVIFVRRFAHGLGDNLLLAGVLPALRKQYPKKKIVVETEKWKDIFINNPYVDFATNKHFKTTKRHLKPKYKIFPDTKTSIFEMMGRYVNSDSICPEIYLLDNEFNRFRDILIDPYITICPAGKQSFASNRKEWGISKFQAVVDNFKDKIDFVQVGSPQTPLLKYVKDFRGLKIRESAAVVGNARLFLGLEGGLMHLAKAMSVRAVIIYGGYLNPDIIGYNDNINIYERTTCSPCATSEKKASPCSHMTCMQNIRPQRVIDEINKILES